MEHTILFYVTMMIFVVISSITVYHLFDVIKEYQESKEFCKEEPKYKISLIGVLLDKPLHNFLIILLWIIFYFRILH